MHCIRHWRSLAGFRPASYNEWPAAEGSCFWEDRTAESGVLRERGAHKRGREMVCLGAKAP
jgi:hypothetical protein